MTHKIKPVDTILAENTYRYGPYRNKYSLETIKPGFGYHIPAESIDDFPRLNVSIRMSVSKFNKRHGTKIVTRKSTDGGISVYWPLEAKK